MNDDPRQPDQNNETNEAETYEGRRPVYRLPLESGLKVLSQFESYTDVLSERELAARSGLSPSTTHKCVTTLSAFGFLIETRNRRYRLPRHPPTIHLRHARRSGR